MRVCGGKSKQRCLSESERSAAQPASLTEGQLGHARVQLPCTGAAQTGGAACSAAAGASAARHYGAAERAASRQLCVVGQAAGQDDVQQQRPGPGGGRGGKGVGIGRDEGDTLVD